MTEEWELVPEMDDFDTGQHNEWTKKVGESWWYIDRDGDGFSVFDHPTSHFPIYTCKTLKHAKSWADDAIEDYLEDMEIESIPRHTNIKM